MTAEANIAGSSVLLDAAADEQRIAGLAKARIRRRRWTVRVTQILILVVGLGVWQLGSIIGLIDPFFFGSPIGIVERLADWFVNGTAYGSFWEQTAITLEEALLGFVFGVGSGVIFGILLGEVPFLADVFGPYIKIVNALPRIVLGSIFVIWLGLGLPSKVLLAAVLVFFVVFFNAFQGVQERRSEPRRQRSHPWCITASGCATRCRALGDDLDHCEPSRGARLFYHRRDRG